MTESRKRSSRLASQRGTVIVQVAVALLALLALSAFVFDYGVMWASRRQAQNSADAGALSGAIALAFDNPDDQDAARAKAKAVAQQNRVWGEAPDVTDADITFPPCPPGAPGLPDTCVKVDVYRTDHPAYARVNPKPLPTFFARLVGITEQGVTATATAQVLAGNSANCVKPFAVPDKWIERNPTVAPWTADSEFERFVMNGQNSGSVLDPADEYIPVGDPNHSGFTVEADYGTPMTLKWGGPQDAIRPGWFFPVVINPTEGPGGDNFRENIATCDPTVIGPGTLLETEPGAMIGPTAQGMEALILQDQAASWSPAANDGRGAPVGGCMAAGTCGISPRLVAIPLFNVQKWQEAKTGGRTVIEVVKILGFWMERMQGNDVVGYLTHYPLLAQGGAPVEEDTTFLRTVILVR
jgi:hypothetical protein